VNRPSLKTEDYQHLLALRTGLRRFLHWSEEQAHAAGLTPSHHQLLLAVRGHDDPRGPTIGDIAGYLLLRHHSAVELAQRAEALELIHRVEDPDDRRVVRLVVTDKGQAALEQLTALHVEELARLADDLRPVWEGLEAAPPGREPERKPAPLARGGSTSKRGPGGTKSH